MHNSLNNRNAHNNHPERNAHICRDFGFPPLSTQFDIAERRKNVCQSTCARGADEFENNAQVACNKPQCHGRYNQGRSKDKVAVEVVRLVREIKCCHDGPANEGLQWQRRKHIETEAPSKILHKPESLGRTAILDSAYSRAMFTMTLPGGKLLRTLPLILSPNVMKPASAMVRHNASEIPVE